MKTARFSHTHTHTTCLFEFFQPSQVPVSEWEKREKIVRSSYDKI